MTTNNGHMDGHEYGAISIQFPQDMFWPTVVTIVCLSVILVESVLAVVILVPR